MCSLSGRPQVYCARERVKRVQEELRCRSVDAMLICDTSSIAWLTAFRGVFDEEQAHALFISAHDKDVFIHTDTRYVTAMEREAAETQFHIDCDGSSLSTWAHEQWMRVCAQRDDPTSARLALEDAMSLKRYRALEEAFSTDEGNTPPFVETDGLIIGVRAVKDDTELRRMQAAQALTDAAFEHIIGFMKPGMTEREVQLELDQFMLANGASALAFPTIVAAGENGASPHAIVSDKRLEMGECVVMDFGACFEGYCSDMTRTVFLGGPDAEMLKAWETLKRANETVQAMLMPGVTGATAHACALAVLDEGGFKDAMGHALGHGVGVEVHELPLLSPRNEKPLEVGNVVTVEPGIYLPGKFGMRLEDFGVIDEQGFSCFTRSTHDLVII